MRLNLRRNHESAKCILLAVLSVGTICVVYKLSSRKKSHGESQGNHITIKKLSDKIKIPKKYITHLTSLNDNKILLPTPVFSDTSRGAPDDEEKDSLNNLRILFFQETGKTPEEWLECWDQKRFPDDRFNNSLYRRALSLTHPT